MRMFLPPTLGCVAIFINIVAIGFFTAWLVETDIMFGHFKGEPEYLVSALFLSSIGILATATWMGVAIYTRIQDDSESRSGLGLRIFGSLCVLATAAPAIIILPVGVIEWPDAQAKMRRSEVRRVVSMGVEVQEDPKQTAKLVRALDDVDYYVRNAAANSLSQLSSVDPSAIPKLIEVALRREELTSFYAVRTLENFGKDAADAIPALIELLDADIVLQQAAGEALAAMGRPAIKPVLEASRSNDPVIRAAAALPLAQLPDADADMRIVEMIDDPDPGVRKSAIVSLRSLSKYKRAQLEHALDDSDSDVRAAAERTLRRFAALSIDRIRAARLELSSPYANNRVNAALALGGYEAAASSALPELRIALSDPELRVRVSAAQAIWLITGEPDESLPYLIEALESGMDPHLTRKNTFRFLRERGPAAKGALPTLRVLEQDPDQGVRLQAKTAIRFIDVVE